MRGYDLTGQRFGKLLVLERDTIVPNKTKQKQWFCLCDCGNTTITVTYSLKVGRTRSCGCLRYIKGHKNTPIKYKEQVHNRRRDHAVPEEVAPSC